MGTYDPRCPSGEAPSVRVAAPHPPVHGRPLFAVFDIGVYGGDDDVLRLHKHPFRNISDDGNVHTHRIEVRHALPGGGGRGRRGRCRGEVCRRVASNHPKDPVALLSILSLLRVLRPYLPRPPHPLNAVESLVVAVHPIVTVRCLAGRDVDTVGFGAARPRHDHLLVGERSAP